MDNIELQEDTNEISIEIEEPFKGSLTQQILGLLRYKYQPPEWMFFSELSVSTGGGVRRLDGFAINCYPSKKYRNIAFEIKISRADFQHEINDPTKREFAEEYIGERYFVCPANLIKVDELPEGWGLLELSADRKKLKQKKISEQKRIKDFPIGFFTSTVRQSFELIKTPPSCFFQYAGKNISDLDLEKLVEETHTQTLSKLRQAQSREGKLEKLFSGICEITKIRSFDFSLETFQDWVSSMQGKIKSEEIILDKKYIQMQLDIVKNKLEHLKFAIDFFEKKLTQN